MDDDDLFERVPIVAMDSPCIDICTIDDEGLCIGCARTLDEIGGWSGGSPEWRAAVMAALPTRR